MSNLDSECLKDKLSDRKAIEMFINCELTKLTISF